MIANEYFLRIYIKVLERGYFSVAVIVCGFSEFAGLDEAPAARATFCPGWAPEWTMRYNFWHDRGNAEEMKKTIDEAKAFHVDHRQMHSVMAGFDASTGGAMEPYPMRETSAEKHSSNLMGQSRLSPSCCGPIDGKKPKPKPKPLCMPRR